MGSGQITTNIPSVELFESLQKAFTDFQVRAERLSDAYALMQNDFKKVNLELDKKNAELKDSLLKQEEMQTYLSSILESMENGVIGVDVNGMITQFNRAACEITGHESTSVIGKYFTEVFTNSSDSESSLVQVLRTGNGLKRNEKVLWHKDGHPVPISYQTALLRDSHGNRIGAVEIFSDISKIKALEEEMHQAKTMAALGEMSATVAHEIRNPLGAMGMWAGLLERDLASDDSKRKTLGKIIEGLSRLNKIVSNLLVYTRPVKTEFRKVQLNLILDEIVDFVQIEIERLGYKISVSKSIGSVPVYVLADPEKIGQVIINLCLNAVQAMSNGGALTVGIEKDVCKNAGFICFSIEDTGSGIEKQNISKIFDPFFTTKENGTGLGLAIVKKFVQSHSGYIDIKSEIGKGTTVRVFIPVLKE